MSKEIMDKKNLQEAMRVKKSGYPTKVHFSPHKDEIDEMIIEKRWSSKTIVNELKRRYPGEYHPSDRTIDNYRKKYLPNELLKTCQYSHLTDELKENLKKQFEPALEGIELWNFVKKMINNSSELIEQTKAIPSFAINLVRVASDAYRTLCDEWARLGLSKTVPTEINLTEKRAYDEKELNQKIGRIIALKRRIDELERRSKEIDDRTDGDGLGESTEEKDVSEKHGVDDRGSTEIQESPAH